jgi:hypothetical protein
MGPSKVEMVEISRFLAKERGMEPDTSVSKPGATAPLTAARSSEPSPVTGWLELLAGNNFLGEPEELIALVGGIEWEYPHDAHLCEV